jgi:hypothetical protein
MSDGFPSLFRVFSTHFFPALFWLGYHSPRLFKIAARLRVSVRRIHIELCSAYPLQGLFSLVHKRLGT